MASGLGTKPEAMFPLVISWGGSLHIAGIECGHTRWAGIPVTSEVIALLNRVLTSDTHLFSPFVGVISLPL